MQDYTMYLYRTDKRCKTGERLFRTTVCRSTDDSGMRRHIAVLFDLYNSDKGWRFEWFSKMVTVKKLTLNPNSVIIETSSVS